MKKIRKLFITHNVGIIGGANHSLKDLIRNLDEKVDLIVPKDPPVSSAVFKDYFGPNINRIYRYYLPFRTSYAGSQDNLRDWCEREFVYRKNKKEIMKLIVNNKYDFIHLNSYVLYPLINKKYPMYIHVREICKANIFTKKMIQKKFLGAKGIIYIDYSTKEALGIKKRSIILNNPFNQERVSGVDLISVRDRYSIQENETVFSFISASNNPEKGLSLVVEAFIKADCKDAKLLIVGPAKMPEYKKYTNILFTGTILHMEEIYAVSDYVLRGESQFCIGRTIYEGLYSGCSVIIPGVSEKDRKKVFEYGKFKNNIFFYKPRDIKSLVQIIRERAGNKKSKVVGFSNEKEYIKRFKDFISDGKSTSK